MNKVHLIAIKNKYSLVYKLFKFAVEYILLIRNKAELPSVQEITYITAMADKKIISVFCVSGGIVQPTSVYYSN